MKNDRLMGGDGQRRVWEGDASLSVESIRGTVLGTELSESEHIINNNV